MASVPEEVFIRSLNGSDWFDVLDFGGGFEQRLTVNLEVFDESHRAVENFFTLCEVAVGYYTLACVHEIVSRSIIGKFNIISLNSKVVE